MIDVDGDINAREMIADRWRFSPIGKQNPAYDLPFFVYDFRYHSHSYILFLKTQGLTNRLMGKDLIEIPWH